MVADRKGIGADEMAHETAARWCEKKDWGDARPRPYWVESCPCASLVDLSSAWRRRICGSFAAAARRLGAVTAHDRHRCLS